MNWAVSLVTINIIFSVVLAAIFGWWYANEKTLAMHSINTPKRELFYWGAILFTFALGTATGDLLAESLKLGYARSVLVFGAAIAVIAIGYYYLKVNAILAFWLAYILTRPLGASIGDLLSQPAKNGGYGLGTVNTSIIFLCIITSLIIYLSLKQKKPISITRRQCLIFSIMRYNFAHCALRRLPPNVWLIGVISLLNDTASDMLYPLIPLYLSSVLMSWP